MTARTVDPESRRRPLYAAVALLLVMVAVLLAAGCISQQQPAKGLPTTNLPGTNSFTLIPATSAAPPSGNTNPASEKTATDATLGSQESDIPFEITGSTNFIVKRATSVSDLEHNGVQNAKELNIPGGGAILRYDIVMLDIPAIHTKLKSGQGLPVRIRGKDYLINSKQMIYGNDYDVDSFSGKIRGIEASEVLFTVSRNEINGHVDIIGESYWIEGITSTNRTESNSSPLHIIYSSKDVESRPIHIDDGPATLPPGVTPFPAHTL